MKTTIPKPGKPGISGSRNEIIARKIVREKYGDPYIPLTCGHMTTASEARLFLALAPLLPNGKRGAKYWCETCGRWQRRKPRKRRKPLPQNPMF